MKKIYLFVISLTTGVAFTQVEPPTFSADSEFYTDEFNLFISHPDQQATIIYTLDGSVPHLDNMGGITYNYKKSYPQYPGDLEGDLFQNSFETLPYQSSILIKNRSNDPNVISAISTTFEKTPYIPQTPVFKSNVVRARAVLNGEYSSVITRNYFVTPEGQNKYTLPIISLNINPDKLYSYEYGLNVAGIKFDQWRQNNPTEEANTGSEANYWKSGSSSELELNFCYIENGVEVLNHNAGLRNSGSTSRISSNRQMRLFAKNGYGVSKFNHNFFNDYDYNTFKRLTLRTSGQDNNGVFFRDAFVHQLVKHLNVIIQEYQPAVMFINSEYNGIYNIRERTDEHYFDRVFGIKENKIDFLENTGSSIGSVDLGDDVHYLSMINFLENNSLADDNNYDYVTTLLDPINYTDTCISYIFTGNPDWPHNNFEYFRKKVDYTPDAPYGQDGRWRWIIKDMDYSYNLDNNWANEYYNALDFSTKLYDDNQSNYQFYNKSTFILRKLLENQTYKNYFINRFADLINTTFSYDRSVALISEMENLLDPEITEHIHRWKTILDYATWKYNVSIVKDFALVRPEIQRNHIKSKFSISDTFELNVDVSNQEHGHVKINTIDIVPSTVGVEQEPYPWTGIYFQGVPITLTAVPKEGYSFLHWEGSNLTDLEIVLSPTNNISLKAVFTNTADREDDFYTDTKMFFPNPFSDMLYFYTEHIGSEYNIYTIDGKHIKNGTIDNSVLDLSELQSGIYILNINKENEKETVYKIVKK